MALQQFGRTKSVTKRSTKYVEQALYLRLFKDGGSEVSVRQQLNEVLKSRKRVYKWEVGETLKKLRECKLYYPALKVRNSTFLNFYWLCYLAFPKTANISYLNIIQVLVNLNDLPGAEKCFREWESRCSTYDIRVANSLIGAYAKEGMLEKAKELKEQARRRGAKPNAKTWEIFLDYYLETREYQLAVDCVANATSIGRGDGGKWSPSRKIVKTLMEHFEQEKDVDGAEGFLEILKKSVDSLGVEVFESLIRTYAAAGKTTPSMRARLKMEKLEVSEATKKLLEAVCVE
ncbi:pentatricopeptide repeat-containing protein At1g60770-like [Prunus avium]|uniref:Pentatricopeptide repeat-containing protein At1g60770-like n=1 Tax=Prunus avium TaxID=42229 RepID=A0A6P5U3U8_PRUAV|nr:pentatricopeptide repeat-containing protein At1g60770-like [Prunus avium]